MEEPISYPAHRYHRETGDVQIVNSQAEADALGPDWTDTPPLKLVPPTSAREQMDWTFEKAEKKDEEGA